MNQVYEPPKLSPKEEAQVKKSADAKIENMKAYAERTKNRDDFLFSHPAPVSQGVIVGPM